MNFLSDTTPRCVRDGRSQIHHGHPISRLSDSVMNVESVGGLHMDSDDSSLKLKCHRRDCETRAETDVVKGFRIYYSCHFCYTYYCSRECRLMDWCNHKTICAHSRSESICKSVLRQLVRDKNPCILYEQLITCGKEGYYIQGRGYVMLIIEHFYSLEDIWNGTADVKMKYIPLMKSNPPCVNTSSWNLGQGIVKLFEEDLHRHCLEYHPHEEFILRMLVPVRGVQYYQPKSNRHYIDKFMELKFDRTTLSRSTTSSQSLSSITNVTVNSFNEVSASLNNVFEGDSRSSRQEFRKPMSNSSIPSRSATTINKTMKKISCPT